VTKPKGIPLAEDFSQIPVEWQEARVRHKRQQGTGHIIEIEFLGGELAGEKTEARRMPITSAKALETKRNRSREWYASNKVPCPGGCGRMVTPGGFCQRGGGLKSARQRYKGEEKQEAAFNVMAGKGYEG